MRGMRMRLQLLPRSSDLCSVATHRKDLYQLLTKEFADNEDLEVILDRRQGERRAPRGVAEEERRRDQRRVRDDSHLLETLGAIFVSWRHAT